MTVLSASLPYRADQARFVARLTTNRNLPNVLRSSEALLLEHDEDVDNSGFQAVFVKNGKSESSHIGLPAEFDYLAAEDVVRFDPRSGDLRVLFRKSAPNNSLLVTERCNSKCLMCSQPPRDIDDGWIVDDLLKTIPLIPRSTPAIGFTGGEITLLGDRFITLLRAMKNYLPDTRLDVLSNGRLLSYVQYAQRIAEVGHPSLTICIPLYSDVDSLHDFVVQARGAFDQTVRGIMNLARVGVRTEIRVVLHQQTYRRLRQLAEFISRNCPYVAHVALMGLEMTGFTKANLEALWIDPVDYQKELSEAVEILDCAGLFVSIYNHQLCLLPQNLWQFSRQSISDWKNIYLPECENCTKRRECGGFFASAPLRYSKHISPFLFSGVPTS